MAEIIGYPSGLGQVSGGQQTFSPERRLSEEFLRWRRLRRAHRRMSCADLRRPGGHGVARRIARLHDPFWRPPSAATG